MNPEIYGIIAVTAAAAVIAGWLVHSREKHKSLKENDEVSDVISRYGLVKSKRGYRFSKYLAPKISEKAVESMTELGWQYEEDTGEFVKPSNGPKDKVLISTVNALIDTVEDLSKDQEKLAGRLSEYDETIKKILTKLNLNDTSKPAEHPSVAGQDVKTASQVTTEQKPPTPKEPEIDVLAAFDSAKTLADLTKIWNTNANKTMMLLQPYLTSKKIIKVGKKYTLNPEEVN